MTPERRAALEEERRFLLASIRDLDREREAGDVDEHDHRVLRDGYVARAGAVLRELDGADAAQRQAGERRPLWRRAVVPVLTLAVGISLGVAVARSAGQRLPGETITGGLPMDDVAVLLSSARQALGSDPTAALAAYDEVLALEPDNAEAVTYRAWLLVLGGRGAGDPALVAEQLPELRRAIEIDPDYADPHCLLAVAAGRFLQPPDTELAAAEAEACLALDPPSMLVPMIEGLVAPAVTQP